MMMAFTVKQLSEKYGITTDGIRRRIKKGKIIKVTCLQTERSDRTIERYIIPKDIEKIMDLKYDVDFNIEFNEERIARYNNFCTDNNNVADCSYITKEQLSKFKENHGYDS